MLPNAPQHSGSARKESRSPLLSTSVAVWHCTEGVPLPTTLAMLQCTKGVALSTAPRW